MEKKNNPVIIGAAQYTQHKKTPHPLDPLSLMVKTSQDAIENTQNKNIVDLIDAIYMLNIISWGYEDAPGELGRQLNIKPKEKVILPDPMGQSPQMLVNQAAKAISDGKHRCVLITGGEALYAISKTFKNEPPPYWPKRKDPKYKSEVKMPEFDIKYRLYWASLSYAIFETAIRASSGHTIEEHRKYMGELFERFSRVASESPFSWTQKFYNAEEITTPTPENRRVVYPYTKRMCANNLVDQAGSIIITSEETAELLGINNKNWVYIMGGADFRNINEIYRRPRLDESPAIREGSHLALEQAGLTLNDIDKFDLYSCFPSIVEITMNEIGINEEDPRDLTITGGLPFYGAPLSSYSLLAIINTFDAIRTDPSLKVMVVANGGFNTKQSIGVYGSQPPKIPWGTRNDSEIQNSILEKELPEPVEKANGKIKIDGYSIVYERTGEAKRGVVVGTLENGIRSIAIVLEPELLSTFETQELVGKFCTVSYDSNSDRNIITSVE
jgi:acetyl-CoA C-acetyltransferase